MRHCAFFFVLAGFAKTRSGAAPLAKPVLPDAHPPDLPAFRSRSG